MKKIILLLIVILSINSINAQNKKKEEASSDYINIKDFHEDIKTGLAGWATIQLAYGKAAGDASYKSLIDDIQNNMIKRKFNKSDVEYIKTISKELVNEQKFLTNMNNSHKSPTIENKTRKCACYGCKKTFIVKNGWGFNDRGAYSDDSQERSIEDEVKASSYRMVGGKSQDHSTIKYCSKYCANKCGN